MSETNESTLNKPEDAGKGEAGEIKRWLLELDLAGNSEKDWRKRGDEVIEKYRSTEQENTFNILWANVEVLRPNIYNSTPKPDVRRRFSDPDQTAKQASEVIKRGIEFQLDMYDFDDVIDSDVLDLLLPGRGQARVRYMPTIIKEGEGEGAYESLASVLTKCEYVNWRDFRRGPASCWDDVPWIAYRHLLTTEAFENAFDISGVLPDYRIDGADEKTAEKESGLLKRHLVWEIWDKSTRKIRWIAPSITERYLLVEEDKLKLKNFFDCPRPLYAVKTTGTLVPKDEFSYYENQAKELDRITQRINKLISGMKLRGIYDGTMTEVANLLKAGDNEMIAAGSANIAMKEGGLDRAFWFMPIEQIAKVVAQLYQQRDQLRATIYEIMGIADIMRGTSDAGETLGAQQLKAQTGSVRMRHRQKEVQRFIRDLFEIMAEIMAEHYPANLLTAMTGINVTPEIEALLRSDIARNFRIDVETNSTVAGDRAAEREQITELISGIGGFVQSVAPAVQAGVLPVEAAKEILLASIRRFEFGSSVEDAIEAANQAVAAQAGQPKQPSPEEMAAAQQAQKEQALQEAEMQSKAQDFQLRQQEIAAKAQFDQAKLASDNAAKAKELELKEREIAIKEGELALKISDSEARRNNEDAVTAGTLEESDLSKQALLASVQQASAIVESLTTLADTLKDSLTANAEANKENGQMIEAIVSSLNAPKEIVRDKQGRVIGSKISGAK